MAQSFPDPYSYMANIKMANSGNGYKIASPSMAASAAQPVLSGQSGYTPNTNGNPIDTTGVTNPFDSARTANPEAYARFTDPNGDSSLYSALSESAGRASAGRRRSARAGVRGSAAGNPSLYGYAGLQSDLQGASDLSGALSGARERSIGANRDYTQGLMNQYTSNIASRDAETRQMNNQNTLMLNQASLDYTYWDKKRKASKKSGFAMGPVSFSW